MADYSDILNAGQPETPQPGAPGGPTDYTDLLTSGKRLQPPRLRVSIETLDTAMDFLDDIARSVAQGVTYNYADDVAAQLNSLLGGESFRDELTKEQARDEAIPAGVAIPGQIAGGVLTSLLLAPTAPAQAVARVTQAVPTALGRALATGVTAGTVGGAVAGSGAAQPGGRLEGAGEGALTGALTGAALAPAMTAALATGRGIKGFLFPSSNAKVRNQIAQALNRDDITVEQAISRLRKLGDDAILADVGGPNLQGVLRQAAGQPGKAKRIVERILRQRAQQQQTRIIGLVDNMTGGAKYGKTLEQVVTARRNAARPLYKQAEAETSILESDRISELLNNPIIRKSLKGARQFIRRADDGNEMFVALRDLPDNSLVLLDQVYKNIGDLAAAAREGRKGNRAFNLDELRTELRAAMVELSPKYGQALDTFSDGKRLEEALQLGRSALNRNADVTPEAIKALPESEKHMFMVGFGQAVADIVENVSDRGLARDATAKLLGKPNIRNRIKAALPEGTDLRPFIKGLLTEEVYNATKINVAPSVGSQTQLRQAEVRDAADTVSQALSAGVRTSMFFGPQQGGAAAASSFLSKLMVTRGIPEKARTRLAEVLTKGGSEGERLLRGLLSAERALQQRGRVAGVSAGGIQPGIQERR